MKHTLLHIYGPFSVHSYGLMIALGLVLFMYLIKRDPRFIKLELENKFGGILLVGILAALFGGRILWLFSTPASMNSFGDLFAFWNPGFSILGSVIACVIIIPLYLTYLKIPVVPVLDLASIYAPLLQSVSRLGCFFAGCCYGNPTERPWGVIYTDPESIAPLYTCLHPAQLYSSFLLFLIFIGMYFILQKIFKKRGQLMCLYIMLISTERFVVDFYRGDDRNIISMLPDVISWYQYIAFGMFSMAFIGFLYFTTKKTDEHI